MKGRGYGRERRHGHGQECEERRRPGIAKLIVHCEHPLARNMASFTAHSRASLWMPNSGNAAAKLLLAKLFAASAEAAYSGYASTRKVKMPENTSKILWRPPGQRSTCVQSIWIATNPVPNTALPMIGTIQGTDGYLHLF